MIRLLAMLLVPVSSIDGQTIYVNPTEVLSIRKPREVHKSAIAPNINCMIGMSDGKFIATLETCDAVRQKLHDAKP